MLPNLFPMDCVDECLCLFCAKYHNKPVDDFHQISRTWPGTAVLVLLVKPAHFDHPLLN